MIPPVSAHTVLPPLVFLLVVVMVLITAIETVEIPFPQAHPTGKWFEHQLMRQHEHSRSLLAVQFFDVTLACVCPWSLYVL